jgi:hypothetical protein
MVKTAQFAGQGYIYRCPHCNKVDRRGSNGIPKSFICRFCEKEFPVENTYDVRKGDELWKIYDEILSLDTGTGHVNGVPTGQTYSEQSSFDADSYFGMNNQSKFKKMAQTPKGMKILEEVRKIVGLKSVKQLLDSPKGTPNEYVAEAEMKVLIKEYEATLGKGVKLTPQEKKKFLKKAGYDAAIDEENGKCYVFFGSTVAPECDYWWYWE